MTEHEQGSSRFVVFAVTAVVALALFAVLLTSQLSVLTRATVSSVGLLVFGVVATISCAHRVRHSIGRRRRAWSVLSVAFVLAAACNLWSLLIGLLLLPPVGASLIEPVLTFAYVLCVVAIVLFPAHRRRGTDLARMLLDGLVIGGSLLFVAGVTIFPQLFDSSTPLADRANTLVLPVLDVLVATLAVLLIVRSQRADRVPLFLVGVGFVGYAVADSAYALQVAQGGLGLGTIFDLGYFVAYSLVALAARHPASGSVLDPEETSEPSPVIGTVILFSLFVAASVVSLLRLRVDGGEFWLGALWIVVILGVIGRQILLIVDNDTLRRGLEHRVRERTQELHESNQRQELLLTSVGDGIYGVDKNGMITFVNPATASILGRTADDLIGSNAHTEFHAPLPDGTPYPAEGCYIVEAITSGTTTNAEEDTYLRGDGESISVDVTASPLSRDGDIRGAVVVFRDVTERREVDRMKSEFVSIVSHELRTPLTSIRGSLGLVAGGAFGELPTSAVRMLNIALESSDRLTRLINDILDIERIESGTMPMVVSECGARELVDEALGQISMLISDYDVVVDSSAVEGRVRADRDRIVQTLINLLGNAVKFSEPGSRVSVVARSKGPTVEFSVADRGRGVPESKLEAIFGRFVQVDSSDARVKGGTGLGLAISRSIVERLGGRIWAESTVGEGTTFRFTLPRSLGVPVDVSRATGPTIVVCDDDPTVVEVLCSVLDRYGYRTHGVTSGERAIALARSEHPAAVVLDLRMAGTSGAEVVDALRSSEATATIPIVVVSGLNPSGDPGLAAETDGWLVKPIDEVRLAETVALAIDRHTAHGSVLIVEDDTHLASVVQALLERRGLSVRHACGQHEALDLIAEEVPQVLILDLHLPDGNGFELVSKLRHDGRLHGLPLVVYSAADIQPDDRDRLSLGRTVFLTKGRITPQQLERRVVELMDYVTGREVVDPTRHVQTAASR